MDYLGKRIQSIPRSPLYAIMELAKGRDNVIRLNIGEPDFDTPVHIREAAKKALDEGYTHYAPDKGDLELKELIAQDFQSRGMSYDPETEILVTAGGQSALFVALNSILDEGDEVILLAPFYPAHEVQIMLAGGVPVPVELKEENDFQPDAVEIEKHLTDKTKAIIVLTPNNPTGAVYDRECMEQLANLIIKHDLIAISDECYRRMVYDGSTPVSIASFPGMKERTIITDSFSKTYSMTGWRVGFLASSTVFVSQMLKFHHTINICANAMGQRASIAALKGSQDCVEENLREFDRRRQYVVKTLNDIPGFSLKQPGGAFYAFPSIKGLNISSMELAQRLVKEAGVITVPGIGFGVEGYLRISYAASLEKIAEGLQRIKTFVEQNLNG